MNGKIVALAAVGLMLAGQASATAAMSAQISNLNGTVVASQDGKFTTASNAMTLNPGDRIVAKDGTAQVKFSDGCLVSVKPQAMLTIGQTSPCASGSGLISASDSNAALFDNDPTGFDKAAITFLILAAILLVASDTHHHHPASK